MSSASSPVARSTCKAIGIDAGGTRLSLAWSDGEHTTIQQAPSVNLRKSSPAAFAQRIAEDIGAVLGDVDLHDDVQLCVGAAGAGTDSIASDCQQALASALDLAPEQIIVTSDARIALRAAFGEDEGILVIAGTGSGCYGLDAEGKLVRAGGWGPGLEDPGSGSELGRAAIKHVLSELEGQTLGSFSRVIAAQMGIHRPSIADVLDTYYRPGFNAAALAPAILDLFDEDDEVASTLIHRQCTSLAIQVARLSENLAHKQRRIAVWGGLTNRASYVQALKAAIHERVSETQVFRLTNPPVNGALSWALEG